MWPWEHLAVGYLCYSGLVHARGRRTPAGSEAWAVALGTQFPDLVDKPLAWILDVLPAGQTLAHSLLFAVPVVGAVVFLGRVRAPRASLAFSVGYLSHLPADAVYSALLGGAVTGGFLLWPLVPVEPVTAPSLVVILRELVANVLVHVRSPGGLAYVLFEATLLAVAFAAWWRDGTPGTGRFVSLPARIAPRE